MYTLGDLSKKLRLKGKAEFTDLRQLLDTLVARDILLRDGKGKFSYKGRSEEKPEKGKKNAVLVGQLSVTHKGLGFVTIPGVEDDLFIAPRHLHTALHGDTVAVVTFTRSGNRRSKEGRKTEGEIVEIVRRMRTTVVGTLKQNRQFTFVVPDDERINRDIYIANANLQQARTGDKVVAKLLPWEDEHLNPEGEIIEVLGKSGDPRVEVMGVAHAHGLPLDFPPEVERESRDLPGTIDAAEIRTRLDLRNTPCFTIDPFDAKDFDDAVSYEVLPDDRVRLGVHIADVSHFIREGTKLDQEAFARGTSVYLVNEVIPMLPERLSNDLCSLRPDVDRLTYSVMMDISSSGTVESYEIRPSVIHSARRFSYEEVQEIIERKKGEHDDILLPLHTLTQTLLKRRRRNGSIDFDTAEAKFRFDKDGLPDAIIKKTRLDAHRLIEECMLLANKTVASHIGRVRKEDQARPFVYRIHDAPDPSRLEDLSRFVKQFGFSLDARNATAKTLQKLLDTVKGSDVESVITEVALRSMAKAVYSEKNIGHFGLAFKYYTHFTSPIRRYPDLLVHRLLKEYDKGMTVERRELHAKAIPGQCKQASSRERVAVEAERDSVKVMQVEYMKRHLEDEFEGVITGVTEFGMFVEINDLLVQGMIRVRDLRDDYYMFEEKHYSLRGRTRNRVFRLGDRIRVRVEAVHPENRRIDFVLAD